MNDESERKRKVRELKEEKETPIHRLLKGLIIQAGKASLFQQSKSNRLAFFSN